MVVYGALVVSFNYFALPISAYFSLTYLKKTVMDRTVQRICKVEDHLDDIVANISKDSELLSVLKSANALSSGWLKPREVSIFWEAKKALEKGEADCSYFSAFTYSNFLYR